MFTHGHGCFARVGFDATDDRMTLTKWSGA